MTVAYEVRIAPRFHGNLSLLGIGRILKPHTTYTLPHHDLQDPEVQRALKDGRLIVVGERTPHPMYLSDKDFKRLEALTASLIKAVREESSSILSALRAKTQTRNDETQGGLFIPEPPAPKKRIPRQDATYVATPEIKESHLQIEGTELDGVLSGVDALRKMRSGK